MTLPQFADLIVTADPNARHYRSGQQGNYTVWAEYGVNGLKADDHTAEAAPKIQIDRFTKIEFDPVVDAITAMLNANDIAFTGPLTTTENGGGQTIKSSDVYIHHIWTCEVD